MKVLFFITTLLCLFTYGFSYASDQENCVQSCLQRPFEENLSRFINMRTCEGSPRMDACSAAIVGVGLGTVAAKQTSYILSKSTSSDAVRKHIREALWNRQLDVPIVPHSSTGGAANADNLNRLSQEAGLHNSYVREIDRLETMRDRLQSRAESLSPSERAALAEVNQTLGILE